MDKSPSDLPNGETLFEHAVCGLLLTDVSGLILRANAALCRWLGYESTDLVQKVRIQDLFTMGVRVFHQTHCIPLLHMQGSVAEIQVNLLHRDRSRIPMLMNVARRHHGATIQDEFAFFVVTERRQYEHELLAARKTAEAALEARQDAEAALRTINEQLSHADRRKDEFLATLAHELRNPLAPMRHAIEILKLKKTLEGPNAPLLAIFDRQLHQLTHLVDDLLEVSRITQGRMELRRSPLALAGIMQAAVADVQGIIDVARHRLTVILPHATMAVDADPTRLTQVIVNLLNNACKYTPNGGHITLTASAEGSTAVISVRDTGIGIPQESLSSIFEMFSQLEPALERSSGGLGIGLALVRGLVSLHGGSVCALSEGMGKGSEFIVRLPLAPCQPAAWPEGQDQNPTRGGRIIVVDDNVDAADTLQMALELHGYQAATAYTGEAGLDLAGSFLPQVALLDIGLPDLNGYELSRRIRQAPWGKTMLLIAATGWGQEADKQRAMEAGFDHHLTKPIDFDALFAILGAAPRS